MSRSVTRRAGFGSQLLQIETITAPIAPTMSKITFLLVLVNFGPKTGILCGVKQNGTNAVPH